MKLRQTMILLSFGLVPAASMADLSANVGMVSDYIYRGIFQEASSAFAGLDYEGENGFYIGTWAADVGDGLETDLYFGTGGDIGDGGASWGVGYTGYYYTDGWDDTYHELNLGLGAGNFAIDVAFGNYDTSPKTQDYTFTSLGYDFGNGFGASFGTFGGDFSGEVVEVGYGYDFNGLDLSVTFILVSDDLQVYDGAAKTSGAPTNAITFGISRSFAIGE
ncbi:MAG: TorF family putative porin [Candidatus Rariloculaceae bacterium]